ncbi:MAG TPA: ABC transporter permease subunit [Chitinophagaceae bacterium]|nr:ABC transporter permease subunit [Chitinophagaceae bacterium]
MNKCIFTIAVNTMKEITRQAIFYWIAFGGISLILFSFSFTLFAFGEEAKMIREMGISTITMCCLCLASLSAANAISREIEKGTIMTLLSKPVNKTSILLGKFFGILGVVFLAFMVMGIFMTVSLCVKESLDYHTSLLTSFAKIGYATLFQLIVSFLQVAIMCTITIAGSVYLPLISNLSCCVFIYIIGNLMHFFQYLFQGNAGGFPWYVTVFYVFFPNMEGFSIVGMGSWSGKPFSLSYMVSLALYAILYMTFVTTLACEFFDKKECT